MSETARTIALRRWESLTGRQGEPLPKPDLDLFRTHLADLCAEDTAEARAYVATFRAARAAALEREARGPS